MQVQVRNPQWGREGIWMFEQPQYHWYQGDEVRPGRWENPQDVLCLTTGNPEFPVRSIRRDLIVSIDGCDYRARPINADVKVIRVRGSKGNEYTVQGRPGSWTCTCPGFQFRHSCKHVAEAA